MRISVCTYGQDHGATLADLVVALRHSHRPPADLVVAAIGARPFELPFASFPVRQVVLEEHGLPLARARNAAAARARGDLLVFLDPDMIPHPAMLGHYAEAARRGGALIGEVAYLPEGAANGGLDVARLDKLAEANPERPCAGEIIDGSVAAPGGAAIPCRDYRALWGDNFAVPAREFARIGGFDERYEGPGGEDTDFARAAMSAGLPLAFAQGAKAYRQHRAEAVPPLEHLDTILANAALFEGKWNRKALEEQLRAFAMMGLIAQTPEGWRKLREPGPAEFALAREAGSLPYPSMAEAVARIERQADPKRPKGPLRPAA